MPKQGIQQIFQGDNIMLVNPNPGRPDYIMVLDAVQEPAPPLVPFSLPRDLAVQIYTKAFTMWNQMKQQVIAEKAEIRRRKNHPVPEVAEHLNRYTDDGKNPKTKKHLPDRPFLVRLDTKEGQQYYEEGLAEAKKEGHPIPTAKDLAGQFPLVMAKAAREEEKRELIKTIRKPLKNWQPEELKEYVENYGGYIGPKDSADKMLEKATRLFDARRKEYEADGFIVTVE
jgi:hypothetical protein